MESRSNKLGLLSEERERGREGEIRKHIYLFIDPLKGISNKEEEGGREKGWRIRKSIS